ncbi:protein white-like [Paramacrobiotus metropolitanus]|uniref:protein white-like n=1 Tax=Paramacrobiotus metropolitanus TaxID=2943436 RepID=UPI002446246B|nr:protein white-like [Paramacrobiotus metropolitanus]
MGDIKLAPLAQQEHAKELDALTPPVSPRRVPSELQYLGSLDNLTLSWTDLNVFIPAAKKLCAFGRNSERPPSKHILHDLSGLVRSGQCVALMGASGAGKTTLLNALNGRSRGKIQVEGSIAVNGKKIGSSGITAISGYVQQVDLFVPTITVREHLHFHAALRMDPSIAHWVRRNRVEDVINELGLAKCATALIGGGHRKGISGGEMKRLAFACEVLTDPPLLFCDEPTSGLDSFMAQTVVETMNKVAAKGKLVICTIHQPSSETFLLFDTLLLLAEGRTAWLGPREEAGEFFLNLGRPIPEDYNPADFYVNVLAIIPGKEEACREQVRYICDQFALTERHQTMTSEAHQLIQDAQDTGEKKSKMGTYKASWLEQMRAVLWRARTTMKREPMLFRVRVIQSIVVGLMFGFIYYRQDMTSEGVMNINGILYMFLMQMTMGNVFAVVGTFTGELPIFLKEHESGMYRSDVYYLCKMLVDLPVFLLIPFVFIVIVYWIVGLYPTAGAFFTNWALCALVANVAVSFGYIVACAFPTTQAALAVGMTLLLPITLFGGLFMSLASIPNWLKWIEYLSWFRYANEALGINQWLHVENITCSVGNFTCPRSGRQVLDAMNFDVDDFYFDIGILLVMIVVFRCIAYMFLYLRTKR